MDIKFDPKKLNKLNNPKRLETIPPKYIWDKLAMTECKTIVDIGAGTGLFSKAFYELMDEGTVYALDISEPMVQWMQDNLTSYRTIIPQKMDESKTNLDDYVADLVLMIALHHELKEPVETLKEAYRLLNHNGKICIIDWKKKEMPSGPPTDIRLSIEKITNDLEKAGFHEIQSDTSLKKFNIVWARKAG